VIAMTVWNRLFHLARADAHGVLDALEDRSLVIRQCLREAELALDRKRARREELSSWLQARERERERALARETELDGEVELALRSEQPDLARFAVRRLLGTRQQRERIDLQMQEARSELSELARMLAAQEQELEELRRHAQSELAREEARSAAACARAIGGEGTWSAAVCDEEIELELLRRGGAAAAPRAERA
jgi:phage shock protein A